MKTRTWAVRSSALVLAVMGMVSVSAQGNPTGTADRPVSGRVSRTARTTGTAQAPIVVPLRFDHYYTYEQVGEALKALQAAYPAMATLDVVGKSDEGRDIWALTVNNPKTGPAASKPGVYVDVGMFENERKVEVGAGWQSLQGPSASVLDECALPFSAGTRTTVSTAMAPIAAITAFMPFLPPGI